MECYHPMEYVSTENDAERPALSIKFAAKPVREEFFRKASGGPQ